MTTTDSSAVDRGCAWSMLSGHFVVWLFFAHGRVLGGITIDTEPYCWPYFESCWRWRLPSSGAAQLIVVGYLSLVLASAGALWHQRRLWFVVLLIVSNLALAGMISLDYRLRANEFYMFFWIQSVYLFTQPLRWTMPIAIVSCYFWAGTIKLNHEWLSGSVLYLPLWGIPSGWAPAACAYVVFLELVAIWGLIAKRLRWLLVALSQLALFHLQSLSQIHWFYPALMATILSWFLLDRCLGNEEGRATLRSFVRGDAPLVAYGVALVFAGLQAAPHFYRGDSTLTGQGRIFALHMFEARQECLVSATHVDSNNQTQTQDLLDRALSPRMVCDPLVYFNRAQNVCRTGRITQDSFDIDLTMRAKRRTDPGFTIIIDAPRFCSARHQYAIFKNNAWLSASWRAR